MKKHFTLIELLVVVAIIGTLASILLPSLAKAKERAQLAVCLGNMKQIATATLSYTNDFNNLPPLCNICKKWGDSGHDCASNKNSQHITFIRALHGPYLSNHKIWGCPLDPNVRETSYIKRLYSLKGEALLGTMSYAPNSLDTAYADIMDNKKDLQAKNMFGLSWSQKMSRVAGDTFLYADAMIASVTFEKWPNWGEGGRNFNIWRDRDNFNNYPSVKYTGRHNPRVLWGKQPFSLADGSVQMLSAAERKDRLADPKRGDFPQYSGYMGRWTATDKD